MIVRDGRKKITSTSFQANMNMLHFRTKAVPVESTNSMSVVEHYHASLGLSSNTITTEAPDSGKEEAFQMAAKAINDHVGPDGLEPTLSVFGARPRPKLSTNDPTPSVFIRAQALCSAITPMSKLFELRQVYQALNTRSGLKVL